MSGAPEWAATAGAAALVFIEPTRFAAESCAGVADAGDPIWIDGDDGHHLARVRRIAPDETVVVADGAGRWSVARVVEVGAGAVALLCEGEPRVEPTSTPGLTIAFAPAKADHGADVTRQLVELGVDRIVPLVTERSVVRWSGARAEKQTARLRRVAREAAAQAHRARIPQVEAPMTIPQLVAAARVDGGTVVVGDRTGSRVADLPSLKDWWVVVGPEGGLSRTDHAECGDDALTVAVGPHVLRAVTAPVAIAGALTVRRDV